MFSSLVERASGRYVLPAFLAAAMRSRTETA